MNQLVKPGRKLTRQQLILTSTLVLLSTVTIYFIWGLSHAQSALAGGCIGIIPNFVFALYAFRYAGASANRKVMDSFFRGAKIKLGLTAVLFALAFKFLVILPVPFFGMFCLAVFTSLLTPMFLKFKI